MYVVIKCICNLGGDPVAKALVLNVDGIETHPAGHRPVAGGSQCGRQSRHARNSTMFESLSSVVANNPAIAKSFATADFAIGLKADEQCWTLHVRRGTVAVDKADCEVAFTLTASVESWRGFMATAPAVGYQTLLSMMKIRALHTSGSNLIEFARYMLPIERLFQTLRGSAPLVHRHWAEPAVEAIAGRYLRVNVQGRPQRLYIEEAGSGIPLLCLHTAGADSRQYRHVLNDTEITSRFRVIAFDLPNHGKSSPDPGFQDRLHVLTTDLYLEIILAVKEALGLDRPVVMGCSIGGRAVLHLALRHGREFRACIGLQSATHMESNALTDLGIESILSRPDVGAAETSAAAVMSVMGPNTPLKERWETLWYYMQCGPGIFAGDLYYYIEDGDMRNGILDDLVPDRCPLYLLTGEYDLSATPAMTAELARIVKPRHFEIMPGVGHFPMSEDPETFRNYLLPVLAMIEDEVPG